MTAPNHPFDPNTQEEFDRLAAQFPETPLSFDWVKGVYGDMFVRLRPSIKSLEIDHFFFSAVEMPPPQIIQYDLKPDSIDPNTEPADAPQFPTGGLIKNGYKYVDILNHDTLYQPLEIFAPPQDFQFTFERITIPPQRMQIAPHVNLDAEFEDILKKLHELLPDQPPQVD